MGYLFGGMSGSNALADWMDTIAKRIAIQDRVAECVNDTIAEVGEFPCALSEMTERELKIANSVSVMLGNMRWMQEQMK